MSEGRPGPEISPSASQAAATAEVTSSSIATLERPDVLNQQLPSASHEIVTDQMRKQAFVPQVPSLGGERSDEDLKEVIQGVVVGHEPEMPTEEKVVKDSARGLGRIFRWGERKDEDQSEPEDSNMGRAGQADDETSSSGSTPTDDDHDDETLATAPSTGGRGPSGTGRGGGHEGNGGGGPEGPRGPENIWSPEFKERGRELVEQIVELETNLKDYPYEVRYNVDNGPKLNKLYKDLQNFVEIWKAIRNDRNPWDPFLRDPEGRVIGVKPKEGYVVQPEPTAAQPENLAGLDIYELQSNYANFGTPPAEIPQIQENIQACFREARRLGLLKGIDIALTPLLDQIHSEGGEIERGLALARSVAVATFRAHRTDTNLGELGLVTPSGVMLMGVLDAYVAWAEERFVLARVGQNVKDHRPGEFNFNPQETLGQTTQEASGQRRKFWERYRGYPKMYNVFARTREEFQIAKNTFRKMLKNNALGDSPVDLLPHMQSFIEVFGGRGQDIDVDPEVTPSFMRDERHELEYGAFSGGASHTMESYNPPGWVQFMTAIATDEGPERFVRGARSAEGKVGQFIYKFDYDPRLWLYHNPGGSRGQIANDTVTQNCLQSFIKEILIEEGMGVVLKDYDPTYDGPESSVKTLDTPDMTRARAEMQKVNLERIGLFQSHEDFKGLYEGFDTGDAHIENHRLFGDEDDQSQLPKKLRQSIELGRVQLEVRQKRQQIREGALVLPAGVSTILKSLSEQDRVIYQEAYEEAEDAFDTAFEMVGILGEKARRGGGVLFVDRNKHVRAYKAKQAEGDSKLSIRDLKKERQYTDSELLGRILVKLESGATLTSLKEEDRLFYQRSEFTDQDRRYFVDHVPVAQGLAFVQYAVTWAQIAYSEYPPLGDIRYKTPKERYDARQAKISKVRTQAIDEFEENGLQARHKVKKVLFNAEGDVTGVDETVTVRTVGFQEAVVHPYSKSTLNPYMFYQQNTRHLFTSEAVIAGAKQLRQELETGLPFDRKKSLPAILLTADPALAFFKSLSGSAMHDEIVAAGAAIEVSYDNYLKVKHDLYARFLPQDFNRNKIRMGYYGEDYGGFSRFVINFIPFSAAHSKRFTRRYIAELAFSPMDVSSMPAMWGQDGVLETIGLFGDPAGEIAGQRLAGQFAITKFIDLMKYGWMMFGLLVGHTDSEKGINIEGWYEKPTDSSENLQALEALRSYIERMKQKGDTRIYLNKDGKFVDASGTSIGIHDKMVKAEIDTLHTFIAAFGRLDKVLKLMRVMYGDVMNKQGVIIPKEDIFMSDGSFNPEINWDRDTGTSRHMQREVFNRFIDWLVSPTGGCAAYKSEADLFPLLKEKCWINPVTGTEQEKNQTRANWIFNKLGR